MAVTVIGMLGDYPEAEDVLEGRRTIERVILGEKNGARLPA
jgi:hypothetical protein